MNTIKLMLVAAFGLMLLNSCNNKYDELISPERNILNISFAGQIGPAEIERTTGKAEISFTYRGASPASIEVKNLELSWKAQASVAVGSTLNFDNSTNTAVITVTAENGKSLDWTVKMVPFVEFLVGTWRVKELWMYGGYPAWGGSAIQFMNQKSWCWDQSTGPIAENDNLIVFTQTGINAEGHAYGTFVHQSGPNGKFADFQYKSGADHGNVVYDLNHIYRAIPTGAGSWTRNYDDGTVTFTFPGGNKRVSEFYAPGAYPFEFYELAAPNGDGRKLDLYGSSLSAYPDRVNSLKSNHIFLFNIKGMGLGGGLVYSDDGRYLENPQFFWVEVQKQ